MHQCLTGMEILFWLIEANSYSVDIGGYILEIMDEEGVFSPGTGFYIWWNKRKRKPSRKQ